MAPPPDQNLTPGGGKVVFITDWIYTLKIRNEPTNIYIYLIINCLFLLMASGFNGWCANCEYLIKYEFSKKTNCL